MTPYATSEGGSAAPSATPQSTYMNSFSPPTPLLETPAFEHPPQATYNYDYQDACEGEDIEETLEPVSPSSSNLEVIVHDTTSLTSSDVKKDPILSDLAHKQSVSALTGTHLPFKAQPAPTFKAGTGPRMTKSSALRAGLKWDEVKPKRNVEGDAETLKHTPGYKRVGLGITVPSLASPSITPRPTKASQLRLKTDTPSSASVKAPNGISEPRGLRLIHQRARSVPSISRLNAPAIMPRQNRTSALRAAGEKGNAGYRDYEKLQQEKAAQKVKEAIALENKEKAKQERAERRKTIGAGLTCFDKPVVEVKQNKTSAMRAAGEKGNAGYRDYGAIEAEKEAQKMKERTAMKNKEQGRLLRGERRKTLGFGVISLNEPEVAVKQNKTSALRAAGEKGNNGYRDYEKIQAEREAKELMEQVAKENKERGRKEREERRKTFSVMPGKPLITPRPNKTSMLRTNSSKSIWSFSSLKSPVSAISARPRSRPSTSHSLSRTVSALKVSDVDNLSSGAKRDSVGVNVKSLGKPSIMPSLNRTAILRTPNTTSKADNKATTARQTLQTSASTPTIQRRMTGPVTPKAPMPSSALSKTPKSPGVGPRPTKASLLRAGLGTNNGKAVSSTP
ncbi:uncharacterized protein I303_102130 [Kwoniella dejecticola CBS 10117]|uniref:Uncharacterized protein n=1 Tax=Kwoniella dejecticola CBS 10117 TaxID=1296121 RepID=A0A1A6ABT0_9TREE|nr:uncharacterized protein I303_01729 [Kwoniella dejecticola CBS 10117]OBR87522.1 hypothetical protein I303_01729 [Kwoniella dejecticola CBS 10117]